MARREAKGRKPAAKTRAKPKPKAKPEPAKRPVLQGEVMAAGSRRKTGGTPEHVPTDENRSKVEALTAYGFTQERIAPMIGVSVPTLVKHYAREMERGEAPLEAKLLESVAGQALGAPALYDERGNKLRDEKRPYAPASYFLLRRQERREEKRAEAARQAEEAARLEARHRLKLIFEHATPEEIEVLDRVILRVRERLGMPPPLVADEK